MSEGFEETNTTGSDSDPFVSEPERATPELDIESSEPPSGERADRAARALDRERRAVVDRAREAEREASYDHETPDPEMQIRLRNAREFARREAAHIRDFSGTACIGTVAAMTLHEAYVHVGLGSYVRIPVDPTRIETIREGSMVRVDAAGAVRETQERTPGRERGRSLGR